MIAQRRGLRRKVGASIAYRARELDRVTEVVPGGRETGLAMFALAVERLERLGHTRESIERLLKELLDAPVENDVRAHTGGT